MSQQPDIPHGPEAELTEVEAALGSLSPSASRLDRDLMMFRAGQAQAARSSSMSTSRWAWPALAASLALLAVGEGAMLAVRPEPRVVERIVHVHVPVPAAVATAEPEAELPAEVVILSRAERPRESSSVTPWPEFFRYMQLRQDILKGGVEALPEPPPLAMLPRDAPAESSRDLLRSEIESLLNPRNPS